MKLSTKSIYYLAFFAWGMGPLSGATFCVETAEELHSTLTIAAANSEDDTVQLVQGLYEGNFVYASTEPFSLSVHGGYTVGCASREIDPTNTVLDGMAADRVLVFSSNQTANLVLEGLTLRNGNSGNGSGLFVLTNGKLNVSHSSITGNSGSDGAGIFVEANQVSLSNNIISRNDGFRAGGVWIDAVTVTLTHNTISNNSVDFAVGSPSGGVLFLADMVDFTNNVVNGNTSRGNTGNAAVLSAQATVSLIGNTISNNMQSGFRATGHPVTVSSNIVTGNRGGAADVRGGTATVSNNTIIANGGGVRLGTKDITLSENVITGNGGGVGGNSSGNTITLIKNLISDNGSGFSTGSTLDTILVNNVITNNGNRGVSVEHPGMVTLVNNTITGNHNPKVNTGAPLIEGAGGVWISLREDTA